MAELLQLMQAGLAVTAVTITVATAPVAIMTGDEIPDIKPIIELIETKDGESKS